MKKKRPFMLLEVLIAFVLIIFCALPLVYPHVFIFKSEKEFLSSMELDHLVQLVFVDTMEKLYQNTIPFSDIQEEKTISIDEEILKKLSGREDFPFQGSYTFSEKACKKAKEGTHAAYLFILTFRFTSKNRSSTQASPEPLEYSYDVALEVL